MFGDITGKVSLLQEAMPSILNTWNGVAVKNGLKYKQIALLDENIKLDLFIVTQESWGVQFAIRTGSSDYSHWLVTQKKFGGALPSYAKIEGGRVLVNGKPIATPEEEDFFNFLGIVMPKPKDRTIQK